MRLSLYGGQTMAGWMERRMGGGWKDGGVGGWNNASGGEGQG